MVTKTIGPLHFEDLEPHRFEDLVRNLLYDFRDWQSLEPTGRAGSDEGYDARGWEKLPVAHQEEGEEAGALEGEPTRLPPRTRVWMIQCKREKALGPADVQRIVNESVSADDPPYGFLLAAPVTFSKKAYDAFRSALRTRGVSEFYLWGRAEIEDMLLMPKNDRILFAFMGISLVTRRRSRTTDVRAEVLTKNKLARALNNGEFTGNFHQEVLVRDINDDDYPFADDLSDFKERPRWQEHLARGFHPRGLMIDAVKHFAYIDTKKKEYDLVSSIDLVARPHASHDDRRWREEQRIRAFHNMLPRRFRGTFTYHGLIRFRDILLVDDKGDSTHPIPHLYLDLELGEGVTGRYGPFRGSAQIIESDSGASVDIRKGYKRVQFFPSEFPEPLPHRRITDRRLTLPADVHFTLRQSSNAIIFDSKDEHGDLRVNDVIEIERATPGRDDTAKWAEIVEVLEDSRDAIAAVHEVQSQDIERVLGSDPAKRVRSIEVRQIYDFSIRAPAAGETAEGPL